MALFHSQTRRHMINMHYKGVFNLKNNKHDFKLKQYHKVSKLLQLLKSKRKATLTKMLVPCFRPKISFSDNANAACVKSHYLRCIQYQNKNAVAYRVPGLQRAF